MNIKLNDKQGCQQLFRMGLRDKTTPTLTTPLIRANMSCVVAPSSPVCGCHRGRCKSWTLDSGLDRGLDDGLDFGPDFQP